jgi:pyrroloquinoline-quinone synthase
MDFWDRIEAVRSENDVLEHPFYQRWSAGSLTAEELARYAGEYRHAVVALASCAAGAARVAPTELAAGLEAHAAEEADHVELWDRFAQATGARCDRAPLPQTESCARTWACAEDPGLLERLVSIYAIERAQPEISIAKLAGLRAHYGLDTPDATAYFELHAERDVEHAAAGRALIERLLPGADEDQLVDRARSVLRANWALLDGVDRAGRPDLIG